MSKTSGTVCFIISGGKVLLAEIEYPNGKKLWNGIGGVVESGETPTQGLLREISEETELKIKPEDATEATVLNTADLELHVFVATKWEGKLEVLDPTLKQLRWFEFNKVPYAQMHIGNEKWLPGILSAYPDQKQKEYWDTRKQEAIVEEVLKYKSSGSVLDLGTGSGRDALFLAKHGFEVTAVDNDETHLASLRERCQDQKLQIESVNADLHSYEPDHMFDAIICDMVLHFFTQPQITDLVAKMRRWTIPGGLNVIAAYSDKNPIGKRPYLFKTDELRKLFEGWKIISYEEKPTPWFQLPGETEPRRNQAVYLITQKPA